MYVMEKTTYRDKYMGNCLAKNVSAGYLFIINITNIVRAYYYENVLPQQYAFP